MIREIIMPQHGSQMLDGDIIEWLVVVGDKVEEGQALVEIEAAKAAFTIESPVKGIIKTIDVQEDDNVDVGEVIATLEVAE